MNWKNDASCHGQWNLFFAPPEPERPDAREARETAAKALCAGCPVLAECDAEAQSWPHRAGIWANLTAAERWDRRYRRNREQVA